MISATVRKWLNVIAYTIPLGILVDLDPTVALTCFSCEMEECNQPGSVIKQVIDCPKESSVCVTYIDRTGRALNKGPGYIYRKQCGAGYQAGDPIRRKLTVNFDVCICGKDLCNGDIENPNLETSTAYPEPAVLQKARYISGRSGKSKSKKGKNKSGRWRK